MLRRLFSEQSINRFLDAGSYVSEQPEPYTDEELKKIKGAIDEIYQRLTADIKPEPSGKPEFVLVVGSPGSGKTTYLNKFIAAAPKQFVNVALDEIREGLDLFKDAMQSKFNLGATAIEADDYAYKKYRNAGLYVGRQVMNRLSENGYNIAYGYQPSNLSGDRRNLLNVIMDAGYDVKVKFIHAPYQELETAIVVRGEQVGRNTQEGYVEWQHSEMPYAVESASRLPLDIEFLWRARHDAAPVLAAKTDNHGNICTVNPEAVGGFMKELHAVSPIILSKLRNNYRAAFQFRQPAAESHDLTAE